MYCMYLWHIIASKSDEKEKKVEFNTRNDQSLCISQFDKQHDDKEDAFTSGFSEKLLVLLLSLRWR